MTGGPATGKTVAVAQWFETLGPVARESVTLDVSDDRPERFWLRFVLALQRTVPGAFAEAMASETDMHRLAPEFLDRSLTEWSAVHRSAGHRARRHPSPADPEITEDLGYVVGAPPRPLDEAVHQPGRPPLPVSRWRGRGWLAEVHQRDPASTLPETAQLLTTLGEHRLPRVRSRGSGVAPRGWVACLRLAAAGLKDRADVPAAVANSRAGPRWWPTCSPRSYCGGAPAEVSEFLLRTSVADVLDAKLCDALRGAVTAPTCCGTWRPT